MNNTIEKLWEIIQKEIERYPLIDQIAIHTELVNRHDDAVRLAMQQEYGTTGWEDEE